MADTEAATFGAVLLRLWAEAGLTQEQLAARAGLSPNAIAALERGRRRVPRGATVELLAGALGLDGDTRAQFVAAARSTAVLAPPVGAREEHDGKRDQRVAAPRGTPATLTTLVAAPPTPLVGRADDLALILRLLTDEGARLLTLVGPAGVGKTRLALAAAGRLAGSDGTHRFPDGVAFVDIAPVRDPDLVPGAIARGLGLLDVGVRPVLERLAEAFAERRLLLVLDNFEQVLPAATWIADLLSACPGLVLLVTSRVPLGLRWERTLRVAPLPVPDPREALPPLEALLAVPSIALFVDRVRARRADFALTQQQAPLVARLTAELDGLPLALELAAVRLDVLSLPVLVRRLGDRLQLLASAAPDRPERQRSLEAAVGWSYDLLTEPEQRTFRCLGVFAGRVSLDAIAAVVAAVAGDVSQAKAERGVKGTAGGAGDVAGDERRALDQLVALAEKSLVLPLNALPDRAGEEEEFDDPEPAFGMLETVREYAEERLVAAGELAAARCAHAHYYLALAERADLLVRGRDQLAWCLRLEHEQDNLRAALRWLLDQDDPAEREQALQLATALGYFWHWRGYHTEGLRWLEEALARGLQRAEGGAGPDSAAHIRALVAAGVLLVEHADYARARALLEEGLALAQQQQDAIATAEASTYLGQPLVAGDPAEATHLLGEARRRWEALGDPHGIGLTCFYLGLAADGAGDAVAAGIHYRDSLQHFEAAGDAHLAGFVHCYFGALVWRHGDLPSAVAHVQVGVRTGVAFQDRYLLSFAAQMAALVGARSEPAMRARLLGAADALAQATGARFAWEHRPGGREVAGLREPFARDGEGDRAREGDRAQEGELAAAYREGQSLPIREVAALALRLLEEVTQIQESTQHEAAPAGARPLERPSQPPDQNRSLLTAREATVLRLVAQGITSKEIGRQLFLAPSTVNYHLTAAFNKLGVDTRVQAVAVAAERGLL
jgi:predicted ATPase/DNA-binding CsgD family transcriptional regulator